MHFHADKSRFEYFGGLIKLKCVAQIEQIPAAMRETTVNIYITTMDNLLNQRLVNWLSSGKIASSGSSVFLFIL